MTNLKRQKNLWKLCEPCLIGCLCSMIASINGQDFGRSNEGFISPANVSLPSSTIRDVTLEGVDSQDAYRTIHRENKDAINDAQDMGGFFRTALTRAKELIKLDEDQDIGNIFRTGLKRVNDFVQINPDDMESRETQDTITGNDIITASAIPVFFIVIAVASVFVVHRVGRNIFLRRQRTRQQNAEVQLNYITIATNGEVHKENERKSGSKIQLGDEKTSQTNNNDAIIVVPPQSRTFIKVLNDIEQEVEKESSNTPKVIHTGIALIPNEFRTLSDHPQQSHSSINNIAISTPSITHHEKEKSDKEPNKSISLQFHIEIVLPKESKPKEDDMSQN